MRKTNQCVPFSHSPKATVIAANWLDNTQANEFLLMKNEMNVISWTHASMSFFHRKGKSWPVAQWQVSRNKDSWQTVQQPLLHGRSETEQVEWVLHWFILPVFLWLCAESTLLPLRFKYVSQLKKTRAHPVSKFYSGKVFLEHLLRTLNQMDTWNKSDLGNVPSGVLGYLSAGTGGYYTFKQINKFRLAIIFNSTAEAASAQQAGNSRSDGLNMTVKLFISKDVH